MVNNYVCLSETANFDGVNYDNEGYIYYCCRPDEHCVYFKLTFLVLGIIFLSVVCGELLINLIRERKLEASFCSACVILPAIVIGKAKTYKKTYYDRCTTRRQRIERKIRVEFQVPSQDNLTMKGDTSHLETAIVVTKDLKVKNKSEWNAIVVPSDVRIYHLPEYPKSAFLEKELQNNERMYYCDLYGLPLAYLMFVALLSWNTYDEFWEGLRRGTIPLFFCQLPVSMLLTWHLALCKYQAYENSFLRDEVPVMDDGTVMPMEEDDGLFFSLPFLEDSHSQNDAEATDNGWIESEADGNEYHDIDSLP